jgi:Flp pilus assembly protein TadG
VAAVEFALLLPVLMLILMGMVDFSYYFFLNSTVVNAAREGARRGAVVLNSSDIETVAQGASENYLAAAGLQAGGFNGPAVDPDFDSDTGLIAVTVTIDPFEPLTGFLPGGVLPATISYTSNMRWESAPPPTP